MTTWICFAGCTAVIVLGGIRLSRYGDILAEKWGLGRTWMGVAMMATVTSLPELATGISAVTVAGVPDIALGDALGSCAFNLLILAGLDALGRKEPISARAHVGHTLSAAFGILLLSVVSFSLLLGDRLPAAGRIGLSSAAIVLLYALAIRLVYRYERKRISEFVQERAVELRYAEVPTRTAALRYGASAAAVVVAAGVLPGIGAAIAASTGLGQTFVGSVLVAVSTSLPEIVVSVAAVRIGAVDLAIGNLLGSNIFNVLILAVDDLCYTRGPLFAAADPAHGLSAAAAAAMTAVAAIGLIYRAGRKRLPLAWDSLGILALYGANAAALYAVRGG